jgi:hypothetical protein
MTIALSTFRAQVQVLVPAYADELGDEDCNRAIRVAVERYSVDFPDDEVDDVTGDAGKYYVLSSSLDSWSEGFSRILSIEYPAATVASDEAPVMLGPEDWDAAYWAGDVRYLYLPNHAPAATEAMRIKYTKPYGWVSGGSAAAVASVGHGFSVNDLGYLVSTTFTTVAADDYKATHIVTTVTDADNFSYKALYVDIPPAHFFAVCNLAGHITCKMIATAYASIGDSTLSADAAAHQTKSETYAARAQDLLDQYRDEMGLSAEPAAGESGVLPAGEFVDWDTQPGWPAGRRFIFHHGEVR